MRSFLGSNEKRSVLVKTLLYFRNRFSAVKNLCKNRPICNKDTAPTFFTWDSRNPSDTAHTNSSREQLLVTKKLSAVSEKKEGDGFIGNELTIYNSEYIMTTPLEKQEYIIYKMMYPGLYILAGHPR